MNRLSQNIRNHACQLKTLLQQGIVVLPGAFNASVAKIIQDVGFQAMYISGAGIANGLAGYPDIGLLGLTEVTGYSKYIIDAVDIPAIIDADTGFGEALNIIRTVQEFEKIGAAGIHLEDQINPKKCGHLDGKQLISKESMVEKIQAAVKTRKNPDFLIIARTDARTVNGMEDALDRAKAYQEAGADCIFPESLLTLDEFTLFRQEINALLLANMTEFGKTEYISVNTFKDIGYNLVIFPMTAFRVMMKVVTDCMIQLKEEGTQVNFLQKMQTRKELYHLLRYDEYQSLDQEIAHHHNP